MTISLKRVYEQAESSDGYRVLVDRLWPRGIRKDELKLDLWLKEVAPSTELRRWFAHEPARWAEFRWRYLAELKQCRETLRPLAVCAREEPVTLLYGARDHRHNNAVVLKQYLHMLGDRAEPAHH